MKKFLNSKFGEIIVLTAASVLNLILTVVYFSCKLSDYFGDAADFSLWNIDGLLVGDWYVLNFKIYFIAAFCVGLALLILSVLLAWINGNKKSFYAYAIYSFVLNLVIIVLQAALRIFKAGTIVCVVFSMLLDTALVVFLILRRKTVVLETTDKELSSNPRAYKIALLVFDCIASFVLLSTFFIPLFTEIDGDASFSYMLINTLGSSNVLPLYVYIAFAVIFLITFGLFLILVSAVSYFMKSDEMFAQKSKSFVTGVSVFSAVFFVLGYSLSFAMKLSRSGDANYRAITVSYIPLILSAVSLVAFSIVQGKLTADQKQKSEIAQPAFKFEPLIYVSLLTVVTFLSLALVVVNMNTSFNGASLQDVRLSGFQLLADSSKLEAGFQIMAFILLAFLLASAVLFVLSLASFLAKNKGYYNLIKLSAFANFVFMLVLGLFGVYFQIAQKINEENLLSLAEYFGIPFLPNYEYSVSSQMPYLTAASFALLLVMIARKQFNLTAEQPTQPILAEGFDSLQKKEQPAPSPETEETFEPTTAEKVNTDFDPCAAFTELDAEKDALETELAQKRQHLFDDLTLPNLVRFVVDYARECRLHLSYSLEDIATFVSGLGASRLAILQGMSGTGKTSLPKIFTEAIMGVCEIVEVESSWRDKNELLGYYNEFSKCFTPKKFTQCLYKARLNSEVPTLIVLDEMNLSRIEYYFSDFLSLMENEEDKREIKLLNVQLFRSIDGQKRAYKGLNKGHTIKIPANVWFVGTANRDESTFEISDKVYDRAQTMNFNKRAPKARRFSQPLSQRFVSYDMLAKLFEDAKQNYKFEAEDNVLVKKTEKLLAPYNISFGNRILKQMEEFVKIYCACFGDRDAVENEAVEKILLSKVVSKLENKVVENKKLLAAEFDKLGLAKCSEFVQKLNED